MLKSVKLLISAPRKSAAQRGYGSRWQKYRLGYLRSHPLCVMCARQGRNTLSTVVDHITPHKGDQSLFWDKTNHQGLCQPCHDRHKKRLEMSGREAGCDLTGQPLDKNHPWNQPPPT
jgi:5-methylcytosine-specific restriction protein A